MKGFIAIVGVVQGLLFLIHYVFYRFGIDNFSVLLKHKYVFGTALFLLSFSFTVSMVLVRSFENKLTEGFYYISAIWLGTILWLFFAVVASVVLQKVFGLLGVNIFAKNFIPAFFVLIALIVSGYGVYNGRNTKIVKANLYINNLPTNWVGHTAVFMSDTHYGNIHTKKQSIADVDLIKSVNPDILFVSGDFFDGPKKDLMQFTEAYKNIQPRLGKYVVSGNHEAYAGLGQSEQALTDAGFVLLDSQNVNIQGVQLIGIPYTTSTKTDLDYLTTAYAFDSKTYNKDLPSIVLKHVPISTDVISNAGASFAFFGHTHRGQMWPFSMLVKKIYSKHYYGFIKTGQTEFYTTSGVGSWGSPQRIGTNSEMLLVTFYKK
jgi:predicted MPP superfamily phosphohydrolase